METPSHLFHGRPLKQNNIKLFRESGFEQENVPRNSKVNINYLTFLVIHRSAYELRNDLLWFLLARNTIELKKNDHVILKNRNGSKPTQL